MDAVLQPSVGQHRSGSQEKGRGKVASPSFPGGEVLYKTAVHENCGRHTMSRPRNVATCASAGLCGFAARTRALGQAHCARCVEIFADGLASAHHHRSRMPDKMDSTDPS